METVQAQPIIDKLEKHPDSLTENWSTFEKASRLKQSVLQSSPFMPVKDTNDKDIIYRVI